MKTERITALKSPFVSAVTLKCPTHFHLPSPQISRLSLRILFQQCYSGTVSALSLSLHSHTPTYCSNQRQALNQLLLLDDKEQLEKTHSMSVSWPHCRFCHYHKRNDRISLILQLSPSVQKRFLRPQECPYLPLKTRSTFKIIPHKVSGMKNT